jgi:tryptophan synthase alpha chain
MGITGTKSASNAEIDRAVQRLKRHTDLPVAVGFGIRNAEQARAVAELADAAVVGSAVVSKLAETGAIEPVLDLVRDLAGGVRAARMPKQRSGAA